MQSPGRRVEHRPRAVLLIQMAIFASFVAVSTCLTGSPLCPRSLDCARAGRYFCQAGSSHCGPCLKPLVENFHGKCVVKRRPVSHYGKLMSQPDLDEEIDFLSTIISQHRTETVVRPPAHPAPVLKFEEEEPKSPASTQEPTTQSHSLLTVALPTRTNHTTNPIPALHSKPVILPYPSNDHVFVVMCSVFIVTGSLALILAGVCWVRLQKGCRLAQKLDYTAYGGKGPHSYDNDVPGDKKLARSAQMYHYQHQKQQMLSLEKHRDEPKVSDSGATSDEENEDGDFTVYECPGLAPTGEMEVKNPLFDDSTLYLQRFHK